MNLIDIVAILGVFLLLALFYFFTAGFFRSPFIPSNRKTIEKMLRVAKIKKGERVIDLGCGDGRIVFLAEKKFHAKAEGYEISIFVWLLAQINRFFKCAKSKIYRRNFFEADLRRADVVFCYLLPEVMKKLSPKFKRELKHGARVVSASFSLPNFKLHKKHEREGKAGTIFVYKK
ncbi:50S ribosomal protein L11 methyltransferase [Patescibacteria group bacterium]|nr:50S ribosomal protein L11 methyltransferase [Patescibacteria group bacterium]